MTHSKTKPRHPDFAANLRRFVNRAGGLVLASEASDIPYPTLWAYLKGTREPSLYDLEVIADLFDTTPAALLAPNGDDDE